MTITLGVNGKYVRLSVVYWWRLSFCTTSQLGQDCTLSIFSNRDGRNEVLLGTFCQR